MMKELDVMEEQLAIAEQAFFEELSDQMKFDQHEAEENYKTAVRSYLKAYYDCDEKIAEVCDGQVVDQVVLNQCVQMLCFAYKYAKQFKEDFCGKSKLFNPASVSVAAVKNLKNKILELQEDYQRTKDTFVYEKSEWFRILESKTKDS